MVIKRVFDAATAAINSRCHVIVNEIMQSLAAHAEEISTKSLLLRADLLTISVNIRNFQLMQAKLLR